MLTTFINTLMPAQADAVCGAKYRARSTERGTVRNGHQHREVDTPADIGEHALDVSAEAQIVFVVASRPEVSLVVIDDPTPTRPRMLVRSRPGRRVR